MRLWTDDVEAIRAEARTAVDGSLASTIEMIRGGNDGPDVATLSRDEQVARARTAMEGIYFPSDDAVLREIAGVPCRVFTTDAPATAVYLHFHGGGMMVGAPEMSDYTSVDLRDRFGMAVVSVDYRLAPEHPHPAGPDDGVAVAKWLLENGEREFGSSRLVLGGESAGGYMSAIVLLRIRDELDAIDRVAGANLVFGVYDWGRSPSQRGIRPIDGHRPARSRRHRVLHRVLPPGADRRRAARPVDLTGVRRPARPAARAHERRHRRPPARRHVDALGSLGRGGQ